MAGTRKPQDSASTVDDSTENVDVVDSENHSSDVHLVTFTVTVSQAIPKGTGRSRSAFCLFDLMSK